MTCVGILPANWHYVSMRIHPLLSVAAFALAIACFAPTNSAASTAKPKDDPAPVIVMKIPDSALRRNKNWLDAPQTRGIWSYANEVMLTVATFGVPGSGARFQVTCDLASKQVKLARLGVIAAVGEKMTLRTKAMNRKLSTVTPDRTVSETLSYLPASDNLLDVMTLPTDRFAVELGLTWLYLPGSLEVGRVVEDCRRTS